jgi:hypothetical protein
MPSMAHSRTLGVYQKRHLMQLAPEFPDVHRPRADVVAGQRRRRGK